VDTAEMRAHDPLLAVRNTLLFFVSSTAEEAERRGSAAAGSGSDGGADAVGSQLQPNVRRCAAAGLFGLQEQWGVTPRLVLPPNQ